ncbi:hypothetical protein EDD17DRAFT_730732 [Pisolithus thermaeus]|nr:hypothetical protein EDD17DRAFT_730732 [Pisolithus thermaeus]
MAHWLRVLDALGGLAHLGQVLIRTCIAASIINGTNGDLRVGFYRLVTHSCGCRETQPQVHIDGRWARAVNNMH